MDDSWLIASALVLTAASGLALYASSPHCMWRRLHTGQRLHGAATPLARSAAVCCGGFAYAIWLTEFGIAAGTATMLVTMMLALAMQPWVALLAGTPQADASVEASA